MRFYVRRRKQAPAVIIVALIDILIVLLIFLMVTTTFKQQPALKLALPESTQAVKTGATESAPFLVSIDDKGIIFLGSERKPSTQDHYKSDLQTAIQKTPDLKLAINADKAAPLGQVIKVSDVAKEAGIKMISLYTHETGKP